MASAKPVLLAALLVLGSGAGLPHPDEDDAGSGGDAGDVRQDALPIDPGVVVGNVSSQRDMTDWYRLDPPPTTVIRVQVVSQEPGTCVPYDVRIVARHVQEANTCLHNHVNVTAGRGQPVNISVSTPHAVPDTFRYKLEVRFEVHDHARPLTMEGKRAAAWVIEGAPGRFTRVEVADSPVQQIGPEHAPYFANTRFQHPSGLCIGWISHRWYGRWTPLTAPSRLSGRESAVWVQGTPVEGSFGPSDAGPGPVTLGPPDALHTVEAGGGNLTAYVGYAQSWPVERVKGWVVWDGPLPPRIASVRANASFWTLGDFEATGDGYGAQAGPVAYAKDLETLREFGDPTNETSFLVVDAGANGPTGDARFTVTTPNGSTTRLSDEVGLWMSLASRLSSPLIDPEGPVTAGTWTVHADSVTGMENDRTRVSAAEFGFPPGCPLEEGVPSGADAAGESEEPTGRIPTEPCENLCRLLETWKGWLPWIGHLLG